VAASKPIYARDENDCDGDQVGVHRTSLVCRSPLGYGIALYEVGLCKGWQIWSVPL
jgi:hypothetical protein